MKLAKTWHEKGFSVERAEIKTITGIQQQLELVSRLSTIVAQVSDINQVYQDFAREMERCVDADWTAMTLILPRLFHIMGPGRNLDPPCCPTGVMPK